MDDKAQAFLERNRSAAMITLRKDGTPHVARVAIILVDGKIWSSGTHARLRTKHLRRDPRCSLFVFEDGNAGFLGLETEVTILDGPDAPDLNLRLFKLMQPDAPPGKLNWFGQPNTYDEFREMMVRDGRLIYQLEVKRAYGITGL
ncbi:MAG TPA: pyridoxamine 5'-phosphate oxidase family protein [Dehalococcoidia bacterium]|nr:pyridoxamine 5'-phosphate oxidase family protein [Dehalococcoidia bacterium]